MKHFNVIIIGGGASGLMCAVTAKEKNPSLTVAILEKNDRVGKKLLATGNGRCNLTHENITSGCYVGSFMGSMDGILSRFPRKRITDEFERLGLYSYSDGDGRYYPISNQASSVLDVLRFACDRDGVEIYCQEDIHILKKRGSGFMIKTNNGEYSSDKLVIACGSKAGGKLGGSSGAVDYLKNLGHKVAPFSPALCPIKVKSDILKSLKGIRAKGEVLLRRNGRIVRREIGEVQFTENALSGICVFNLSLFCAENDTVEIDLCRDIEKRKLIDILNKHRNLFSAQNADCLCTGIFQKRLAQAVMKLAGVRDFSRKCGELSDEELENIADTAKRMSFTVSGLAGMEQAQCSKGGLNSGEIDSGTMKSKRCENLYVCGEAIDICGVCGGYNLHFAFASGIIAGENL